VASGRRELSWDTSFLLPMDSVAGNLLHLLAGYEARPSGMQVVFYVITFVIILSGMHWSSARIRNIRTA
jgi:high-affinity iron transporter